MIQKILAYFDLPVSLGCQKIPEYVFSVAFDDGFENRVVGSLDANY
ncbi:hypothetical protein SDC9_135988 [bioreactor metagenome]|uniref:Uncharacterized protein n=1 Tax=bioreactor metagenome TaxID=1076179 RepID=A0A645DHC8_9ZZZZ